MTTFENDDLSNARFNDCRLDGAEFRESTLVGARFIGSVLIDVEIDALVQNVTINGVDVGPLVEAELDRRHPERLALRPTDVAGSLAALDVVDRFWDPTLARVRRLPEEVRDTRVDDEWSTVETLRHLLLVYDMWFGRAVLGEAAPHHSLGLPATFMDAAALGLDLDPDLRPALDDVLAARKSRQDQVREHLAGLDDEALRGAGAEARRPGLSAGGRGEVDPRLPAGDPRTRSGRITGSRCVTSTCSTRRSVRTEAGRRTGRTRAVRVGHHPDVVLRLVRRQAGAGLERQGHARVQVGHGDVEMDLHLLLALDRRPDGGPVERLVLELELEPGLRGPDQRPALLPGASPSRSTIGQPISFS